MKNRFANAYVRAVSIFPRSLLCYLSEKVNLNSKYLGKCFGASYSCILFVLVVCILTSPHRAELVNTYSVERYLVSKFL